MFSAIHILVQTVSCTNFFNSIQDGPFQDFSWMGGKKAPPSYNLSYTSYNDETWYSYT